jgi:hypothetical protein
MGRIEECFLDVLGQEEIVVSTTYRILCLERENK